MTKKEVIALVVTVLVLAMSNSVRAEPETISYEALFSMISLAIVIFVGIIVLVYKFRRPTL